MSSAIIITIGNELLDGFRLDTNSFWLSQQLNLLGIKVTKKISIGDDFKSIWNTIKENEKKANLIILTGGLGPTSDDITKPLLAKYFGGKMVCHRPSLKIIKKLTRINKRQLLERNIKQSFVPSSCNVFLNTVGTAPCMCFEKNELSLISLPGVPFEVKTIFIKSIIPYIKKKFVRKKIIKESILIFGVGESVIAEKLINIEKNIPENITLSYLPSSKFICLSLKGVGDGMVKIKKQLKIIKNQISVTLKDNIVSLEHSDIISCFTDYVKKNNITIACAESCSGGYISHLLTKENGASKFFMGSIVSYSNLIKQNALDVPSFFLDKYTAVSKEVAESMNENLLKKFSAQYGLSITGYLSNNNINSDIPVGKVFICVGKKDTRITKELNLRSNNREENMKQSSLIALFYLLDFIKKDYLN